jgi:hypothetical protein
MRIPVPFFKPKYFGAKQTAFTSAHIVLIPRACNSIEVVLSLRDLNFNDGKLVFLSLALRDLKSAFDATIAFTKSLYVEFMTSSGTSK